MRLINISLGLLPLMISAQSSAGIKSKPNIIILYADDLGWGDLGCYGNNNHQTPNLDKLANKGVKFTNAYAAAPISSASRASILTGKSPARLGFEFVSTHGNVLNKKLISPKRTINLALEEICFSEIVEKAGYKTAMFGKWHVAEHNKQYLKWSDKYGPLQQGFQTGDDDYGSHPYAKKNRKPVDLVKGEYPNDVLVEKAMTYIENNKDSPYLLYFSSYYVHTPVLPNNSWLIEKYKTLMPNQSMDKIRYACFVETMDYHFGKILDKIVETGQEKNTIVIFTSDNGAQPGYGSNFPLRGNKWNLYEGGVKVPFIVYNPLIKNNEKEIESRVIAWDILPTIAEFVGEIAPKEIDGVSLLDLLKSKDIVKYNNRALYWHFPYYHPPIKYEGTTPCSSIILGNYKLIYFYEDNNVELYNLEKDLYETTDLSIQEIEKTNELRKMLFSYLYKVGARFPYRNINKAKL
jgi:uncharacterized sulfatase